MRKIKLPADDIIYNYKKIIFWIFLIEKKLLSVFFLKKDVKNWQFPSE